MFMDTTLYPGDKIFLAVPPSLERIPEEYAVELDEAYPGLDFEVVESEGLTYPKIIFVYRDPRAMDHWLTEQRVADAAQNGIGLTPDPEATVRRGTGDTDVFPPIG